MFPLMRGMLEAEEHMNDTRHSQGSCLNMRIPRYCAMAALIRSSAPNDS